MSDVIRSEGQRWFEEAPEAASIYLSEAVQRIDRRFGEGYAKMQPTLTGTFMLVAALDYTGTLISQQIGRGIVEAALDILDAHSAGTTGEPTLLPLTIESDGRAIDEQ